MTILFKRRYCAIPKTTLPTSFLLTLVLLWLTQVTEALKDKDLMPRGIRQSPIRLMAVPRLTSVESNTIAPLLWRYATKQFNPSLILPDERVHLVTEAGRLAPTGYGLQPFRLDVVPRNPIIRHALYEASYKQNQTRDASHLIIMSPLRCISETHIDRFVQLTAQTQHRPLDAMSGFKNMISSVLSLSDSDKAAWAQRQAYIALGFMLTTAAHEGIDACPMEGIQGSEYDRILNIPSTYKSLVQIAIGIRDNDKYTLMPKVRFPSSELITWH
jgi:nitroreductase